jgi:hypothetical protein
MRHTCCASGTRRVGGRRASIGLLAASTSHHTRFLRCSSAQPSPLHFNHTWISSHDSHKHPLTNHHHAEPQPPQRLHHPHRHHHRGVNRMHPHPHRASPRRRYVSCHAQLDAVPHRPRHIDLGSVLDWFGTGVLVEDTPGRVAVEVAEQSPG